MIARHPLTGEIVLAHDQAAAELRLFDAKGQFERLVGRKGGGPGEYQNIVGMQFLGDSLFVVDRMAGRLTVLHEDTVVRTLSITPFSKPNGFALFPDGSFTLNVTPMHKRRELLHHFSRDGKLRKRFLRDTVSEMVVYHDSRVLEPAPGNTVLAAMKTEYTIEQWSSGGELQRRLRKEPEWFRPYKETPPRATPEVRWPPTIVDLHLDRAGRLWVVVLRSKANWLRTNAEQDTYHRRGGLIPNFARDWESVIELFDFKTGELVLSRITPATVMMFLDDDHLVTYDENEDGTPVLDLWRMTFRN